MKKKVTIIGGGAAALAAAAFLDKNLFEVQIFEKKKTPGKGGFNVTHSEPMESLITRYSPSLFLKEVLLGFTNKDFGDWLFSIGIPTFVGSSNRVFPEEGIKPIEVLKAIQDVLVENGVEMHYGETWTGWDKDNNLIFNDLDTHKPDYTIFALGGGSWKITGSDGAWLSQFEEKGINTIPFRASNCAYKVDWKEGFISKQAGSPLKNIAISCLEKRQKGEVVITPFGLEGNAIYGLSPEIRSSLVAHKKATIFIDLKPTLSQEELLRKLKRNPAKKTTLILRNDLKLSSVQINLLKAYVSKEVFLDIDRLALSIKSLPLEIIDAADIDEAISTVGGVSIKEVDFNFQLKSMEHTFCIGEMLDWDAPTGGYLLQACFSMGYGLAEHLNTKGKIDDL
jgi:uncharacterized flavoprotein (TIGR03862 family)